MLLRLKRKLLRLAHLAQNDIGARVRSDRHIAARNVGDARKQIVKLLVGLALPRLAVLNDGFEARHLLFQSFGARFVFGLLGLADLLGGSVAACLRLLQLLNRRAALLVEAQNLS